MSYFNDIFNPKIEAYEAGTEYKERTIVKYNGLFYIAKKDTQETPEHGGTTEDWEYIPPGATTKIFANLGCVNNGYPISLGTAENPFYGVNVFNSVNLVTKNKTAVPGFMSTLRFGTDMSDGGSAVNVNAMYDVDYQNPAITAVQVNRGEVSLGSGIFPYRDVYTASSPITLSDKEHIAEFSDMRDLYLSLFDKLRPVEYRLHTEYSGSGRKHIGFLADEVEAAMQEVGITPEDFAGLVKIPIYKKDIYRDFEINEHSFGHYHYEAGEEIQDTEENYEQYLAGTNLIRYCHLPVYKKELGYIYFKNYPKGSFSDTKYSDDMDIAVKRLELVPYDAEEESLVLDISKLIITDDYPYEDQVHHEIAEDGMLRIHYDDAAEYKYVRISLTEDGTPLDCTRYKYLKVISDFEQPYLIGFSDVESAQRIDDGVDYFTSEYGDMYSYAQDYQYEVAAYIYALRPGEFIPILAGKLKCQEDIIQAHEVRLAELEKLIKK